MSLLYSARRKISYQDIMPISSYKKLSKITEYVRDIRCSAPRLSALTLVLLLIASLFEGFGYILLLPIVSHFGLNSAGSSGSLESINPVIDALFNALYPHLSFGLLLILFLATLVLRAALNYFAASSSASLKGTYLHAHRASLHNAVISAPWAFLSTQRRSSLTHALTTQSNIIVNGVDTVFRGTATLFTMSVAAIIAAALSWKITFGIIGFSLIIIWPLKYFNKRAFQLGEQARGDMAALFEHNIRYFKGLKTVKAASAEQDILSFFEDKSQTQSAIFSDMERNHARASLAYQLLSAVFLVGFVYLALTFFPEQKTQIIVLVVIFARLAPRANALQSYVNHLAAMMPEYQAAKDLRVRAETARETLKTGGPAPLIQKQLSLSNIGFSYSGEAEASKVLNNITFSFPVKSSTAIVGPSGVGKTTLADILAGLLSPSGGEMKIDRKTLTEAERNGLAGSIQYITDEDFLFDDNVRLNLSLGHNDVSDDDIWKALKKANADDFISALPQGLETLIGDSGARLSHGQRQRLSLTRGLLGNPQVLILDEPTSALSQQDVKQITYNLKTLSQEMIVIIITHDEPNFQWVDQIIRIDAGCQTKSN